MRRGERQDDQSKTFGSTLALFFSRLFPLFQGFYILGDVYPSGQTFDAVLVHGAMTGTMIKRLDFLIKLMKCSHHCVTAKKFYFLTGRRELNWGREGEDIARLKAEAEKKGIKVDHLNYESDVAALIIQVSDLPEEVKQSFHVVCAPQTNGNRPNTVSTIKKWREGLPEMPQSILAISNNPYILQQHAALRHQLMDETCTIETVGASGYVTNEGDKVSITVPADALPLLLDTLARALYEDIRVNPRHETSR